LLTPSPVPPTVGPGRPLGLMLRVRPAVCARTPTRVRAQPSASTPRGLIALSPGAPGGLPRPLAPCSPAQVVPGLSVAAPPWFSFTPGRQPLEAGMASAARPAASPTYYPPLLYMSMSAAPRPAAPVSWLPTPCGVRESQRPPLELLAPSTPPRPSCSAPQMSPCTPVPTAGAAGGNPLVPAPPFIGSPPSVATSAASSSSCTPSISSFSPGHLAPSSTWEIIRALQQADSRPASDVANVLIQLLQQQQGEPSAMIPTAGLLASVNGGPFESAFGGIEQPDAAAPATSGESGDGGSGSDIGPRDTKRARAHEYSLFIP
jgi:hypothetical protein